MIPTPQGMDDREARPSSQPTVRSQSRPDQELGADETQWYEEAAEQGIASAQWVLGALYENGEAGFPKDYAEALRWYRRAASQDSSPDNVVAKTLLGLMYEGGRGVPQSFIEAARSYRRAAEQGYATAQQLLGTAYFNGQGVPQDYAEAHRWLLAAAEQGKAWAQWTVGVMYHAGLGVKEDFIAAYAWLSAAATEKDENAVESLSAKAVESRHSMTQLMTAEQIEEAQRRASELRKRIDKNRKADPMKRRNRLLESTGAPAVGRGSAEEAQQYQEAAAELAEMGIALGQWRLGVLYANGEAGFPQDYAEALRWFRRAADQDSVEAQSLLGLMYAEGRGVIRSVIEAARWFRRAAEQGYATAQWLLGTAYVNGEGVPQDYDEAFRWLQAAAEQGNPGAQWSIGVMYRCGLGVKEDFIAAYAWLRAAAAEEVEEAVDSLDEVTELMTAEQIVEARHRASELRTRIDANRKHDPLILHLTNCNGSVTEPRL